MPRVKIQLADNIKRVVTFDTDATVGATLGTNLLMPNGQIGTPASVLEWLGSAIPASSSGGSSGTPIGNYLTTKGDLLTRDTQVQRLPIGAQDAALRVSAGGLPQWRAGAELTKVDDTNVTLALGGSPATALLAAVEITVNWAGELAATRGGTGHAAYALGDILYADTETSLETLGAGPDGWVLTMYGGYPSWSPPGSGGVVDAIVPGIGIAVDDTDPANPIVALDASVSELNDVDVAGIQDGDVLIWDQSTSQWVVGEVPPPNIGIADLNDVDLAGLTDGDTLVWDASTSSWVATAGGGGAANSAPEVRGASFSGGTTIIVVPTNNVPINIREDCTITAAILLTQGGTGSCVLDIWKQPYGSYPPTVANSICSSNKPTISSGVKNASTLVGWDTALSANDTLLVNLTSCSTFTAVSLFLVLTPVGSTPSDGYTDERARDVIAAALTDTATVQWTYDDTTDTIEANVPSSGASSGSYTPTLTGLSNVTSTESFAARWTRIGNYVTVSGTFGVTPAASGSLRMALSIPVASTFTPGGTDLGQCAGVATSYAAPGQPGAIAADSATPTRAEFRYTAASTATVYFSYIFNYEVI
jgi:hypothetical protein